MASTSLDLSQIKTDALSAASTFRTLIGLGNVNNTSDANKPISSATQSALDGKLSLTGGTLTGGLSGTTVTTSGLIKGGRFNTGIYEDNTAGFSTYQTSGHFFAGSHTTFAGSAIWSFRAGPGYLILNDGSNGSQIRSSGQNVLGGVFSIIGSTSTSPSNADHYMGFRFDGAFLSLPLMLGRLGTTAVASANEGAWLVGEASDTLALRRSTNAQRFNLYGTYTDASNYRRLYLSSTTAGAFTLGVEGAGTGASGNTLTVASPLTITGYPASSIGLTIQATPSVNVDLMQWRNGTGTLLGRITDIGNIVCPRISVQIIEGSPVVNSGTLFLLDGNHSINAIVGQGLLLSTFAISSGIFLQQVTGHVGINKTGSLGAMLDIVNRANTDVGLRVKGAVSQSAAMISVVNSSDVNLFSVSAAGNGTFSGHLSATTKSFLIDHPTKPGRKLQYGSLESPYHGIRLTGRSFVEGGIGVIELPDYVRAFVSDDVNIQLTPVGRNILWVHCIDLNNNQVIVGADSDGDFYWSFTGIRTDVELEVEPWA